jgi:hypothetical protein
MEDDSSLERLRTWRELYVAALFENDKPRIGERIAEAQMAIVARRRTLTLSVGDIRERHALDSALFSLEALRTCLAILPPGVSGNWQRQVAS